MRHSYTGEQVVSNDRVGDNRVAAMLAGCVYDSAGYDLTAIHGVLGSVLEQARTWDASTDDPRAAIAAQFGRQLLGIVAPDTSQEGTA